MNVPCFKDTGGRLLVLIALITMACVPFATAADRALLVGVGDYKHVSGLPGIHLDVDMMREAAERLGFQEIRTLMDQEATYDRFRSLFERWLIEGTRAGDRVLLYFSGHGGCVADQNGDESDGKDEALVLYDTRLRGDTMERALRDDEFHALLQRLSGRRVLVLIDACHSGTSHKGFNTRANRSLGVKAVRVGRVRERWETYTKSLDCEARSWTPGNKTFEVVDDIGEPGVAFLAAAADHELALATPAGSLFTLGLHKAINDMASAQQSLTLQALRDEVDKFIRSKIDSGDVHGEPHQPQFWGNPAFPIRPAAPSDGDGPIWRRLVGLADHAHRITPLSITANQGRYRLGDELVLTIDIPHAGYLNVVNVGSRDNATVLFPNRHHRDNYVRGGTLTLPTPEMRFRLRATRPTGRSLNVAFLTEERVDLFEEGVGGRDRNGNFDVLLAALSAKAKDAIARSFAVTSANGRGAAGGKVIVEVVR